MIDFILPFHLKTVLAARTDDRMLSLGTGQTKHGATLRTFAVNMGLSIAEFVFAKTEEPAKAFVLTTALDDVAREHSEEDQNEERDRQRIVKKRERKLGFHRLGRDKERADRIGENDKDIHAEQNIAECIAAVASIEKTAELIVELTHNRIPRDRLFGAERFDGILLRSKARRNQTRDKG